MEGYPTTFPGWLTFISIAVTVVIGAVSIAALAWAAVRHTTTEASNSARRKAARLQELAAIIYNKGHQFGLGAQLLAIDELRHYARHRASLRRYVDVLRRDYQQQGAAQELFDALNDLDRKLGR